jgi:hypothetical protein
MSERGTETEEATRRILADSESERETGAKSRRAPKKNLDGTLNLSGSRPSRRVLDRNPSGSPPIIIAKGNPNRPQSPKIGAKQAKSPKTPKCCRVSLGGSNGR